MIYLEFSATCVRVLLSNEADGRGLVQILLRYSGCVVGRDGSVDKIKLKEIASKLAGDSRAYGISHKEVVLVVSSFQAALFKFKESSFGSMPIVDSSILEQFSSFVPHCSIEGMDTFDHLFSDSLRLNLSSNVVSGFAMCTSVDLLTSLVRSLNELGLKVVETRSTALGIWRYVSSSIPDGVKNFAVLDMGSSFTRGLLVMGGEPTLYFASAVGSHHVTRDLAYASNLPLDHCETIKHSLGLNSKTTKIRCNGQEVDLLARPWIEPRVSEILRLSLKCISPYLDLLDGGIVLTGGGARLPELINFANSTSKKAAFSLSDTAFTDYERVLGGDVVCDISDEFNYGFEGLLGAAVNRRQSQEQINQLKSLRLTEGKGLFSSISRWLNILTSTE